jgi:hypothetical protein
MRLTHPASLNGAPREPRHPAAQRPTVGNARTRWPQGAGFTTKPESNLPSKSDKTGHKRSRALGTTFFEYLRAGATTSFRVPRW